MFYFKEIYISERSSLTTTQGISETLSATHALFAERSFKPENLALYNTIPFFKVTDVTVATPFSRV